MGEATALLMDRWRQAHIEYRAEVSLGWDRQKLFLTLPTSITAAVSLAPAGRLAYAAPVTLVCAALVSLAGMFIVLRSHGRYRATRAALQRLEDALGIEDLQTTGGQRSARDMPRLETFRVVDVLVVVYGAIATLDVVLALLTHPA